eukprot:8020626-Pyramimonas_sp.AAC.1
MGIVFDAVGVMWMLRRARGRWLYLPKLLALGDHFGGRVWRGCPRELPGGGHLVQRRRTVERGGLRLRDLHVSPCEDGGHPFSSPDCMVGCSRLAIQGGALVQQT